MSFSLHLVDEYDWPVRVSVPRGGAKEEHQFTARFRHLGLEEVRQLVGDVAQASRAAQSSTQAASMEVAIGVAQLQIEQAMRYWVGWGDDLIGPDGQPLPYSDEAKRKLLGVRIIREAVVDAWQQSQSGEAARLGNSGSSPAGGAAGGKG